jgi:signal transduction histidine kinase
MSLQTSPPVIAVLGSSSENPPTATPVQTGQQPEVAAGIITHEIRNPLTSISLAAEMLKPLLKGDIQIKYLDTIVRASFAIDKLLNELIRLQELEQAQNSDKSIF